MTTAAPLLLPCTSMEMSSLKARRGLRLHLPDLPATLPKPEHLRKPSPLSAFQMLELLGQGTASVVRRARRSCQEVALKIVRTDDEEMVETAKQEYDLLKTVDHPHIVRAMDFLMDVGRTILVMELFEGLELDEAAQRQPLKRFAEAPARRLFSQLLGAVDHLHKQRILHRDLKGPNVLVSHDGGEIKLVDFNTARRLSDGAALTMTGTSEYAAPEVLMGCSHSDLSDIWSAGLCLHLMLSGRLPRQICRYESFADFTKAVASTAVELDGHLCWQEASDDCKAVLRQCLAIDKTCRPAAMTLLTQEAWFATAPRLVRQRSLEDAGESSDNSSTMQSKTKPQRKRRACSLPTQAKTNASI